MGFKLKAPYRIDWTSIFRLGDDEGLGINGVTTNTGNILTTATTTKTFTSSHQCKLFEQI